MSYREDFDSDVRRFRDAPYADVVAEVAPDVDPDVLWAAALAALDDVGHEVIPDQRPQLRKLRDAFLAVHPATIEEVFNPEGPIPSDFLVGRADVVAWIESAIESWGEGRPPKVRERAVVRGVAAAFQRFSGYTPGDATGYVRDLLLFVAVFCHQSQVEIPRSYDALAAWLPPHLKRPFQGQE